MASIPSARAGFLRRLGYYAIGLAVGFVMLGMFQNLRSREHAARQAAQPGVPVPQSPAPIPAGGPLMDSSAVTTEAAPSPAVAPK